MSILLENVTKRYGEQTVLSNINVSFENGKIHGLVGRNGSGKTQLFKVICGYVIPESGNVWVDGKKVGKDVDFPSNIGVLIESPGFLMNYSGLFNLELLGLGDEIKKRFGAYSLGMRQRLGIAQAIMDDPQIIILDEPFNGLDNEGVYSIRKLLLDLKNRGKTIILASHNPYDIEALCDSVYEMDAGVISKKS